LPNTLAHLGRTTAQTLQLPLCRFFALGKDILEVDSFNARLAFRADLYGRLLVYKKFGVNKKPERWPNNQWYLYRKIEISLCWRL